MFCGLYHLVDAKTFPKDLDFACRVFLPCVFLLLLLQTEASVQRLNLFFVQWGSKYHVKAQALSELFVLYAVSCSETFTRGYDVRSCSALKDVFVSVRL